MIDCGRRMKYCKRITASDEAFILFLVLNSWFKWTHSLTGDQYADVDEMNDNDNLVLQEWKEKKRICASKYGEESERVGNVMVPNLYSGDKRKKSGIQGQNGWSTDGIKK